MTPERAAHSRQHLQYSAGDEPRVAQDMGTEDQVFSERTNLIIFASLCLCKSVLARPNCLAESLDTVGVGAFEKTNASASCEADRDAVFPSGTQSVSIT